MSVHTAIKEAESILPGIAAQEGELDRRWQAIIAVGEYVEAEPEAIWLFARRWGASTDEDLRMAIATCILEHLLEHHFDLLISRVEDAAREDRLFSDTLRMCSRFGLAAEPGRGVSGHREPRFSDHTPR